MIYIIYAIGTGGLFLFSILIILLLETFKNKKLAKHRSKAAGFVDLLNYAAVIDDGIIVGKNGSLMAAWMYKGDDAVSSTDQQKESASSFINRALLRLGNGWMIHVDAIRNPSPAYSEAALSKFPDTVTQGIDQERRELFETLGTMYEGGFVLTATYFPPILAERKFADLMFDDEENPLEKKSTTALIINQFKTDCQNLESRLSTAIKMTRLKSRDVTNEDGSIIKHDDFLSWLQFCLTGIAQPIVLPTNPMYIDSYLGGQEFYTGSIAKVGKHFIQVVSIEGFPLESTPGMLTALTELPSTYRWSSRFIFMDAHEAIAKYEKYRKKWKQKIRGIFDQIFNTNSSHVDEDAVSMVADAQSAIADINSGVIAHGFYTSVVVLMDQDRKRLESSARMIEKSISSLGFVARVETVNTTDAYLGSLPGHGVENVRRPLISTMNLADLLPTSSIWTGENYAPCPFYQTNSPPMMHCVTNGSTPFRLNLHQGDIGHTFMFGPTGAGKSTHLALTAAQLMRYEGMNIFAFDKGMSMYPLAAAINASTKGRSGLHFSVAADDEDLSFCPLQFLETKGDRAWAMEWIDTILALNGVTTTPHQRNEIGNAIISMHKSNDRTLSEFTLTVQDEQIREALKPYTIDGAMGHLLDAEKDGLYFSNFTVFEIEELMNLGDKYALPILLYIFRRIERSLKGQPAAIILDEAWIMLGHKVFRDKIREWFKVLRKANCLVLMATQSLSDAANSGILDVIIESTATKIFLPNIYARDEDASALYRRMGLNTRQIEILATAIPKRQYYYMSAAGRRLYELALGPYALAFVGISDKDSIQKIKRMQETFGVEWVAEWLKVCGISSPTVGAN